QDGIGKMLGVHGRALVCCPRTVNRSGCASAGQLSPGHAPIITAMWKLRCENCNTCCCLRICEEYGALQQGPCDKSDDRTGRAGRSLLDEGATPCASLSSRSLP